MDVKSGLTITKSEREGRVPVTIFHLKGRINMSNAGELEKEAKSAFEGGAQDILFDLKEVPSLTSAGLRAVHVIYKMLSQGSPSSDSDSEPVVPKDEPAKSPHLKIANPSPDVLNVLQLAGFSTYISIYDSVEDAVASF